MLIFYLGYSKTGPNSVFDILTRTDMVFALLIGSVSAVITAIYLGKENLNQK